MADQVSFPTRAPLGRGFTGALAGIIAALCCAVLALVASGGGAMGIGGKGATTVLAALCGPSGCRVMDSAPAYKGLDPLAAEESLAQLDYGRHLQKKHSVLYPSMWRHARRQAVAVGKKPCTCLKATKFARRSSLCTCHCEDDEDGPCPAGDQSFVIPMHESDTFVPPAFEAPGAVQSW